MVVVCSAFNCTNNAKKQSNGSTLSFYSFPLKRPEILGRWVAAVRRDRWKPTKYSKLCEKHFAEDSFQVRPNANRRLLKPEAIPTIFDFPKHLQNTKKPRKPPSKRGCDSSNHDHLLKIIRMEHQYSSCSSEAMMDQPVDTSKPAPHAPVLSSTETVLRKKIKVLRERLRRREIKMDSMRQLIDRLCDERMLHSDGECCLQNSFSGASLTI